MTEADFYVIGFLAIFATIQLTSLARAQRRVAAALERMAGLAEKRR